MTPFFARTAGLLIGFGVFLPAAPLPAQDAARWETPLELLPESAQGGLVVRSIRDLRQSTDDLLQAVGIHGSSRPGEWIAFGLGWLGIQRGIDENAPLGLIFTDVGDKGHDFEALVLAIPVADRQAVGQPLGLNPDESQIVALPKPPGDYLRLGAWTPSHLLLSGGQGVEVPRQAVASLLDAPRLSRRLTPAAIARLNDSEIIGHVGIETLARRDPSVQPRDWPGELSLQRLDPDERAVADDLSAAVNGLQHALFAVDLEDGLTFHTRMIFQPEVGGPARPLLSALLNTADEARRAPTLAGLPAGPVFAAFATRLTEPRQQLLLRALSKVLTHEFASDLSSLLLGSPSLGTVTDLRQALLLGMLADVLPLASELRGAIYPNPDGTFGVLFILESHDPQRIVETLRELADLVALTDADLPRDADNTVTDEQFRRLTRELAADDFRTRNRAGARLLLAGDRSRHWLREATASDDPEVAARAAELLAKIEASRIQREQQLLQGVPLIGAHPHVVYQVAAAEIAARPVDMLRLTLPESEAHLQTQLQELFGADWNRIRIVTTPRQVVVSVGAVGPRFEQALELLRQGYGGLQDDPRLARLPDDPDRLLTLHLPVSRLLPEQPRQHAWRKRPADLSLSRALTAWGLSASESELWFDVHFPVDELRGFAAKYGWWW